MLWSSAAICVSSAFKQRLPSFFFFCQAEDGIRDGTVTGVQTCALPILPGMRERLGQVDTQVLSPDAVPGRPAADTGQHHQRPENDRGDLGQEERPAREATADGWPGRPRE